MPKQKNQGTKRTPAKDESPLPSPASLQSRPSTEGFIPAQQKAIAAVLGALAGVEALVPPTDVVDSFESVCAPLLGRMRFNLFQTRTIAALRDTLLLKLLAGELRVSACDAQAGVPAPAKLV